MTQLQQTKPTTKPQKSGQVNPFARALAEMEKSGEQSPNSSKLSGLDAFRDALKQPRSADGGNSMNNGFGDMQSADFMKRQQEEAEKQQKREALRKKLHDQVNPVETQALFDAREKQVKEQINSLRYELKMLAVEVKEFTKEVDLTLATNIAEPGQTGSYYLNFFQQLRTFIMLLRQKIKSARTWMNTAQGKKSKQGMQIKGQQYQKTATVQNMMHHERSSSYAGA